MNSFDSLWKEIQSEAIKISSEEPSLSFFLKKLASYSNLSEGVSFSLAQKFRDIYLPEEELMNIISGILSSEELTLVITSDIQAICSRDPACTSPLLPLIYFKGFLGLCSYRISSALMREGREHMAFYFQSLASQIFNVDIHPKAVVGKGILLDHATGFVAGETAIIEDEVSILHEVTLGGNGKEKGERHPIVRSGVLLGAGAKVLGRVEIGKQAKVGAGSVVLSDVPPHTTVAGVPAVVVGEASINNALNMDHSLPIE